MVVMGLSLEKWLDISAENITTIECSTWQIAATDLVPRSLSMTFKGSEE